MGRALVRRWAARLLLATVAALLPLGAMEGMLRLMYPGSVDALNNASFTRVSMRPGQMTELIPGAVNPHFMGAGVRVNSLGFRGPELDAPKPAGRFRLLAVGDSVTFGFGVAEEEGFVSLLAEGLKAKGKDGDIVNHGLPGAGLPYNLHSIRRTCEPLDADAVIVSVVLNDIVEYRPGESLDVPVPGSRATPTRRRGRASRAAPTRSPPASSSSRASSTRWGCSTSRRAPATASWCWRPTRPPRPAPGRPASRCWTAPWRRRGAAACPSG